MKVMKRAFVAAIAATMMFITIGVAPAAAARHVVVRAHYPHVVVHPRFVVRPRGALFIGGAWYAPGYAPVYVTDAGMGEIVIKAHYERDARIYVDGGLAGYAGELKHFALPAGPHEIEIRDYSDRVLYHDRIEVLPGETRELRLA